MMERSQGQRAPSILDEQLVSTPKSARRRSWFGLGSPAQASSSKIPLDTKTGSSDIGGKSDSGQLFAARDDAVEEMLTIDGDLDPGETATIRRKKKKKRRSQDGGTNTGDEGEVFRLEDMPKPLSTRRDSEATVKRFTHDPGGGSDSETLADTRSSPHSSHPLIPPRSSSAASTSRATLDMDKIQPPIPGDRPLPALPDPRASIPTDIVVVPSSPKTPSRPPETPQRHVRQHNTLLADDSPLDGRHRARSVSPGRTQHPELRRPSPGGLAQSQRSSPIGLGRPKDVNGDPASSPSLGSRPIAVSTPTRLRTASPVPKIVFAEPDEKAQMSGRETPTERRTRVRRSRSLSGMFKPVPSMGTSRESSRANSPELPRPTKLDDAVVVKAGGMLGWLGVKKTVKRRQSEGKLPRKDAGRDGSSDFGPRVSGEKQLSHYPTMPPPAQPASDVRSRSPTKAAAAPKAQRRLSTLFTRRPSAKDELGAEESDSTQEASVPYPVVTRPIPISRTRARPGTAESSQTSLRLDDDSLYSAHVDTDQWNSATPEGEETLYSPGSNANWGPGVRPWMEPSNPPLSSSPLETLFEKQKPKSGSETQRSASGRNRAWSDAPRPSGKTSTDSGPSNMEEHGPPRSLQPSPFEGVRPKMPGRSHSSNAAIINRMRAAFSRSSTKDRSPNLPARNDSDVQTSEFGSITSEPSGGVHMRPSSSSSSSMGTSRFRSARGPLSRDPSITALLDQSEGERHIFLDETPERSPRTSFTAASVSSKVSVSSGQSTADSATRKGRVRASTLSAAPSTFKRPKSPQIFPVTATPPRRRASAISRISQGLLSSGASSPRGATLFPLPPRSSGSVSSGPRDGSQDDFRSSTVSTATSPRPSAGSISAVTTNPAFKTLSVRLADETPAAYLERISQSVGGGDLAVILASSGEKFMGEALNLFMKRFDFVHTALDVALRKLLMYMSLPKETQQIDRIIEAFATRYEECEPGLFGNKDNTYILAFSMIMLHTDAFNKHNKNKMTKADYVKNTRLDGVSPLVLEAFYDNITYTPFINIDDELQSDRPSTLGLDAPTPLSAGPSTPSGSAVMSLQTPKTGKQDIYQLIATQSLDSLQRTVEEQVPLNSPFECLGTRPFLDIEHLHSAFTRAFFLPIVPPKRKSSTAGFMGTTPVKSGASEPPMTLRVTKVGLLSRKDDSNENSKKLSRKWKSWSVILTGSQLLFFKDPAWALSLIDQMQVIAKDHSQPRLLSKAINFKPDEVFPVSQCIAVYDRASTGTSNTFRYIIPPGRGYLLQASDEFEMNEWINLINYASTFRTADIRMRNPIMPRERAVLAGAAAAASHKRENAAPSNDVASSIASPRKAIFGDPDSATSQASLAFDEPVRRPSPLRIDSATMKKAVDVDTANQVVPDPGEGLEEIFGVVKADLAAGRGGAKRPVTPDAVAKDSLLGREHLTDVQVERKRTIERQIHRFQAQAKHHGTDLNNGLLLARNLAILTPFQRSSRDRISASIPALAQKIRQSRLHLAKVRCWIDILHKDLEREHRDWTRIHHLALQAATKTLREPDGVKTVVEDVNQNDGKANEDAKIPVLSLPTPDPLDSTSARSESRSPTTPNVEFNDNDLLGRSPCELPVVIRRSSEDDPSRPSASRHASSSSLMSGKDQIVYSRPSSRGSRRTREDQHHRAGDATQTPNQESSTSGRSTPMLFALSDAEDDHRQP